MSPLIWFSMVLWLATAGPARPVDAPVASASRAFERLRTLTGEWAGTVEWSGARSDKGRMRVSYSLTGNGSVVVENLIPEGDIVPAMTSVYHLDGPELRMTHYCGAKNQPRFKATKFEDDAAYVGFSFVDATGLEAHPAHVSAVQLRFMPGERLRLQFTFEGNGRSSVETIDLQRGGTGARERSRKPETLRTI
jgi:hypothetical protein